MSTTTRQRPRKRLDVDRRVLTTTELTPDALAEIRILLGSQGEGLTDDQILTSVHQIRKRVEKTERMGGFLEQLPALKEDAQRYQTVQDLFRKNFDYYANTAKVIPRDIKVEEYIQGAREIIEILAQYGPLKVNGSLRIGRENFTLEDQIELDPRGFRESDSFIGLITVKNDLFEAIIKTYDIDRHSESQKSIYSGIAGLSLAYALATGVWDKAFPVLKPGQPIGIDSYIGLALAVTLGSMSVREYLKSNSTHLVVSLKPNKDLEYTPEQVADFRNLHRDLKTYKI